VKQPVEADFDIQVRDAEVEVTFKPTMCHCSVAMLADRRRVLRERD